VGAPVTAQMVAELRGGGKDFGSKVRDQGGGREELGGTSAQPIEKESVGCLRNARAWERSLSALVAGDDRKFEASLALSLSGVQATRLPLPALGIAEYE
jgi:hypothetical protein